MSSEETQGWDELTLPPVCFVLPTACKRCPSKGLYPQRANVPWKNTHSQVTLLLGPERQLGTSTGHAQAQACLLCHPVPVTTLVLKSQRTHRRLTFIPSLCDGHPQRNQPAGAAGNWLQLLPAFNTNGLWYSCVLANNLVIPFWLSDALLTGSN